MTTAEVRQMAGVPDAGDPAKVPSYAAELLREVNHTAAHHSAYAYPSEVYDAYGAMVTLLERLAARDDHSDEEGEL